MSGNDADFAGYLTARWPALVRTLVLIGCPRSAAEAVAESGLAHCYLEWDRTRHADDVDVHVHRELLDAWHRHPLHRHPPEQREPIWPPDDSQVDEELDEAAVLRHAVEDELDALAPERRTAVVLALVGGLSGRQVAEVLESAGGLAPDRASRLLGDHLREASEAIDVLAAPYDSIVGRARTEQRRRRRRTALGILGFGAAVAVVAGVSLALGPQEEPPTPQSDPTVTDSPNPVDIAWYAAGRLHLDDVIVAVPPLTAIVEVNGGVVYADRTGEVVLVAADGTRTTLGEQPPGGALAASGTSGWAAWVDLIGGDPALTVYDVDLGEVVDAAPADHPDAAPIAVEQEQVYYALGAGSFRWEPPTDAPEPLARPGLLDVAASARAYQDGPFIDLVQPFYQVSFRVFGHGAVLSPGGTYAISRTGAEAQVEGAPYSPLLYDTRTGRSLRTGVGPDELVVDAAFGRNQTAVYLVGRRQDFSAGAEDPPVLVLRSCVLGTNVCQDLAPLPPGGGDPVLAH